MDTLTKDEQRIIDCVRRFLNENKNLCLNTWLVNGFSSELEQILRQNKQERDKVSSELHKAPLPPQKLT